MSLQVSRIRRLRAYCRKFDSGTVTKRFNDLRLLRLGFEHRTSAYEANTLPTAPPRQREEKDKETERERGVSINGWGPFFTCLLIVSLYILQCN